MNQIGAEFSNRIFCPSEIAPEVHIEIMLGIQPELRPAALKLDLLDHTVAAMIRVVTAMNVEQRQFLFPGERFEVAHGVGYAIHLVIRARENGHPKRAHQTSSCCP